MTYYVRYNIPETTSGTGHSSRHLYCLHLYQFVSSLRHVAAACQDFPSKRTVGRLPTRHECNAISGQISASMLILLPMADQVAQQHIRKAITQLVYAIHNVTLKGSAFVDSNANNQAPTISAAPSYLALYTIESAAADSSDAATTEVHSFWTKCSHDSSQVHCRKEQDMWRVLRHPDDGSNRWDVSDAGNHAFSTARTPLPLS